ncbi:hypothetical protein [Subtercola boreus]|uniref:Uncharacterized protein n=1 Tax=Subtercola boreus TaxID=120213 RepID=A0A3E0WAA4_9MICO|nr:hypothetical protein [Subtercola boreus]RFA19413.1 hypothetical protein B7R24_12300 [Subtercola boreus]RFA19674.1 hypothetical protein B7R23_12280 [Subtercola boreus]RFA26039.1 hypothetical protein B7R25_12400 [Subtercola boreus]
MSDSTVRARVSLAIVAALLAVVSVIALVTADFRPPASVIGWAIAGPIAVSLLAIYAVGDARARLAPEYVARASATWVYRAALVVTSIAIVIDALSVGVWLGRL